MGLEYTEYIYIYADQLTPPWRHPNVGKYIDGLGMEPENGLVASTIF